MLLSVTSLLSTHGGQEIATQNAASLWGSISSAALSSPYMPAVVILVVGLVVALIVAKLNKQGKEKSSSDSQRTTNDGDTTNASDGTFTSAASQHKVNGSNTADDIRNGDIRSQIKPVIKGIVKYIKNEFLYNSDSRKKIAVGIGERGGHDLWPKKNVVVPYLLEPFVKLGFKDLLAECLFRDIGSSEWQFIYNEIDSRHFPKDSLEAKVKYLRNIIEANPDRLEKLSLNLRKAIDEDGFLGLIIRARELGIVLHGIYTSEACKLTSKERRLLVKNEGLSEAGRLLLKEGIDMLLILSGDAHVGCLPLNSTDEVPDSELIVFGNILFGSLEAKYLNLSIVNGTWEEIEARKDSFATRGYEYYQSVYETLKSNQAFACFIRAEREHRIILVYNSPSGAPAPKATSSGTEQNL